MIDENRATDPSPLLIGGEWVSTSNTLESLNPADGSLAGSVCIADDVLVDQAVDAAWTEWRRSDWSNRNPHKRARVLRQVASLLESDRERLAQLQMRDSGKPIEECRRMVDGAAGAFNFYSGVLETYETEVTPSRGEYWSMTVIEPYGVVGLITPWNSPLHLEGHKAAAALAAGNAIIIKPSEETPQLALELGATCIKAGVPAGLINVLNGPGSTTGATLVGHRGVRMISFTGGTDTGREIARVAADRLVPAALELGGKSPHIVFEDANLELAIDSVAAGIFGSAGQSCVAGSRLFVQESIYERFVARLAECADNIRTGMPSDPATEMGPLISQGHRSRVEKYIGLARHEGGRIRAGGTRPTAPALAHGSFIRPTVIDGLPNSAQTCQEEIFGPVIVAIPFRDEADLIKMANDTVFGLACGIWTGNYHKAWRIGRAIEAGSVWINCYKQSSISSPFGGFKESGLMREKGRQGLRLYGQVKSMYWGLSERTSGWASFGAGE